MLLGLRQLPLLRSDDLSRTYNLYRLQGELDITTPQQQQIKGSLWNIHPQRNDKLSGQSGMS